MRINHFFPHGNHKISATLGIIILVVIWIILAPVQVGGLASYVIVIGTSMEPNFHIGDLVIVHKQPLYQVGDAVVYHNIDLQSFVFHRIIAEENGHFSLQGDNNSWVDHYEPAKEELLGKLWLHIPRGGTVFQKIRSPFNMALIAAALGLYLSSGLFSNKAKGNKHMNNKTVREWFGSLRYKTQSWLVRINSSEFPEHSTVRSGGMLEGSFFVLGLVLLSSLIIGIISFSRSTTRIAQDDMQYQHLGIFSYLATAPQGVYDSNTISSGDPIFPRLTCIVDVNLQYTFIAPQAENITGTYQLTAVLREQVSGWQRRVPLQEEIAFTGTAFGSTAKLDLCKIESLTKSLEQQTDSHSGSYTLLVTPNVETKAALAGQTIDSTFDSGPTFLYDGNRFYLAQDTEAGNPMTFTKTETSTDQRSEVNTVLFLGKQLAVPTLRWMAMIGLIVSLSGFVFLGVRLQTLSHTDQDRFLRIKYESLIVDVQNADSLKLNNCIDVLSIDALAKLADRFNVMILHTQTNDLHEYFVQSAGTTYRFTFKDSLETTGQESGA